MFRGRLASGSLESQQEEMKERYSLSLSNALKVLLKSCLESTVSTIN